jgi:predicted Rossmann-fold nucleotide-binding protein
MEELLEMITWCQLGIHDKPVSELLQLIDQQRVVATQTKTN